LEGVSLLSAADKVMASSILWENQRRSCLPAETGRARNCSNQIFTLQTDIRKTAATIVQKLGQLRQGIWQQQQMSVWHTFRRG